MTTYDTKPYIELKKEISEVINDYISKYGFFAFSNEQLKEGIDKFKPLLGENDKLVQFINGGFMMKSKVNGFFSLNDKMQDKLREKMQDPEFAGGAFLYEAANYEYAINSEGDFDVVSQFGHVEFGYEKTYRDYLLEAGFDQVIIDCYRHAICQYTREAEEKGIIQFSIISYPRD